MTRFEYKVSESVFQLFPNYARGVVVALGVHNGESPPDLLKILRDEEDFLRAKLSTDTINEEPRFKSWREAYKAFGAAPSKFRSSVEAMTRRVVKGDSLPTISRLVDIGNLLSLRHLVPVGGHSIDHVKSTLALRTADGNEEFIAFGSDELEHPSPGEVIFAEGNVVLTRRWTWRQAKHTLVESDTTNIEFNIDALPPVTPAEVEKISEELHELLSRFCGGRIRPVFALTKENTSAWVESD